MRLPIWDLGVKFAALSARDCAVGISNFVADIKETSWIDALPTQGALLDIYLPNRTRRQRITSALLASHGRYIVSLISIMRPCPPSHPR
jgi:hypothetical protein